MKFIDACVQGLINTDAVDDHIDSWHCDYLGDDTLIEYLGMTEEEYGLFVFNESNLEGIVDRRRLALL